MVMKAEPIFQVIDQLFSEGKNLRIIMPSPQGKPFSQEMALAWSQESRPLIFICGHYEGIDERVRLGLPAEEVSLGDYVLTGGELASLVMVDATVRLIPGVLGDAQSMECDSFMNHFLDFPHYTRPVQFRGMNVPEVLLSGNHEAIRCWRKKQGVKNTLQKRPDLLSQRSLDTEEKRFLEEIQEERVGDPGKKWAC
jgi:tRNA (guanine37-N1)-methyltransferase